MGLPEGIIEFIPEIGTLISEINDILAAGVKAPDVPAKLTEANRTLFSYLPKNIRRQLLLDRDSHGNVMVSKIESEKLIAPLVAIELEKLRSKNQYKGSFRPQYHFYGYEGRCGLPSNFDCQYCHAIGRTVSGTPISGLLNMEWRHGHSTPVIKKALTELDGAPFAALAKNREKWALQDCYRSPGPVQYSGVGSNDVTFTLRLEVEARLAASKKC